MTGPELEAIEARLNAATDAYYEQLAPRCSYRSAGDGAACGLMSGHDGPHTMLMPPPKGWGFVADMSKDLRALVAEARRLQADNARLTEWAERAARDENANAADLARVTAERDEAWAEMDAVHSFLTLNGAAPTDHYRHVGAHGSMLPRVREIVAERDTARADVIIAAGECMVPIPTPGSDMARVMIAGRVMRRERDKARAALQTARVDGARAMLVRVRGIASSIDLAAGAGELSDTINGAICALDPATVADEAPAASQPAPVALTNCRTCAHDFRDQEGKARCWIVEEGDPIVDDWIADDANVNEDGEPTPTATGCPGWRARA